MLTKLEKKIKLRIRDNTIFLRKQKIKGNKLEAFPKLVR